MNAIADLSPRYWDAFKSSLFQQSWVYLAAVFLLDSLKAELFVLVAIAGHWLLALVVAFRRPTAPTRMDLLFCEFGSIPVALLTVALSPIVWWIVGDRTLSERWFAKIPIANEQVLLPVQIVAGIWIIAYFVLEVFWRKRKAKVSKETTSPVQDARGVGERQPKKAKPKLPKSTA